MGCCFSSNEPRTKMFDQTAPRENFNYLRPEGTITFIDDRKYNISLINIQFDEWFERSVCLSPKDNRQRENFLLLERAPPPTPSVSSFSDSGVDTVL